MSDLPPEAWPRTAAVARRLVSPIQRFLAVEAASGLLLLVATVAALALANSAWHDEVHAVWATPIGASAGDWSFTRPLHFWVNDGLMTVFFFVVGLEIRREMYEGELSEPRRAALPLAAAVGGMIVPAAIYAALNAGGAGAAGWAIPMATDIAFAVGVLTVLGRRVPPALRVLLLALAVIDDIGAILVIAVFYSGGFGLLGLGVACGSVAAMLVLRVVGIRQPLVYVIPAIALWGGMYAAGIHPTLAGVVLGMLTPVKTWSEGGETASPSETLQHLLHPWVAFLIMPLFAFVNAGVALGGAKLDGDAWWVFVGIVLGLVVGKLLGVFAASRIAIASRLSVRPRDVSDPGLAVVGAVAGIGFTMSLFIAQLAFPTGPLLATAKLAILTGSGVAMVLGALLGVLTLRGASVATTEDEAERDHEV